MRYAVLIAVVVVAGLTEASTVRASCASAVYVDGYLLSGVVALGYDLPADDGQVDAVFPSCNDVAGAVEPDVRGIVTRLEGLTPTVAVRDGATVYVGEGQMTMLAGHPLHTDSPARRRCSGGPTRRLEAVADFGYVGLRRGGDTVLLDGQTQLTNRPVTTPMVDGQAVRATTSRCGRRTLADEVTFLRPILEPERQVVEINDSDGAGLPWWAVLLMALGVAIAVAWLLAVAGITRALRRTR